MTHHLHRRGVQPLNHKNYGAYQSVVNQAGFGQPRQNLLNAYQPRDRASWRSGVAVLREQGSS